MGPFRTRRVLGGLFERHLGDADLGRLRAAAAGDQERGERAQAVSELRGSLASAETTDMALYAAGLRRRLGQLVGGREGEALIAQADEWMSAEDVRRPSRMTDVLAPGFAAGSR